MYKFIKNKFFAQNMDFRIKIFNLLATTGFIVSLVIFAMSLINGASVLNSAILLLSALISAVLLIYSAKTGNYRPCYIITVTFVFMLLFPIMFFTAGGYNSGMPCFFVFAVVFTLFMLEGKAGIICATAEIVIYVSCCVVAYRFPQIVTPFPNEKGVVSDVITGICVASSALGATMFFQIKMYNEAMNEAHRSNKAKGIFLANMSHEIRTPINVILGMNELIIRSSDHREILEYTSKIQSAGDMLLSIINNILDVTQIESGKIMTSVKPYRIDSLVSELVSIGSELSSKKGLTFIADISPNMMSMLEGDKNHLKQIVTNFLSNAIKYTQFGSVTLSAETFVQNDNNEIAVLKITVSDTGIGIPDKELEHIFKVFGRGKNAVEYAVEGTGLGLAIAKDLADSMGGRLIVKSCEGKGSTFGIEIPQKICNSTPIGKIAFTVSEKNCSDSFIAPECRILAVDDNAENLRVISLLLERTMITVDTASDGISAAKVVKNTAYDLILLDYMMPIADGIQTLKIMRENGLSVNTPVIALTAEALSGSEEKFISAGFSAYLSKPISWHTLEKMLITMLPADKVIIGSSSEDIISPEELRRLSELMNEYDISLDSGLSYLSGNITRFRTLAKIFSDGYEHNRESLENMFDSGSDRLIFEIHSLKSAAKGIGAISLFEIAKTMENHLANGDFDYAEHARELLMFIWKRVAEGMKLLVSETANNIHSVSAEQINSKSLEMQIKKGLEEHIWLETQNALQQLINKETDMEAIRNLTYISEFVDELDFVSAETLFNQFMERRKTNEQ
ncbi:MAG: ATP-binding protein [Oscillospiraceae bacterium]